MNYIVSRKLSKRERSYMIKKKFFKQILKPLTIAFMITPTMDGRDGKERFR